MSKVRLSEISNPAVNEISSQASNTDASHQLAQNIRAAPSDGGVPASTPVAGLDRLGNPDDPRKAIAQKLSAHCARLEIARDNDKAFFNIFYKLATQERKLPVEQQVHGYARCATIYSGQGLQQIYTMAKKCWPIDKRSALAILAGDPFTEVSFSQVADLFSQPPDESKFPPLYARKKIKNEYVYDVFLSMDFNIHETVVMLSEYLERELPGHKIEIRESRVVRPKFLQLRIEQDASLAVVTRLLFAVDWITDVLTKGIDSHGEIPAPILD